MVEFYSIDDGTVGHSAGVTLATDRSDTVTEPGDRIQRDEDHAQVGGDGTQSFLGTLHNLARAMRPRQWSKNLLVFIAPAAAGMLDRRLDAQDAVGAFAIFCAVASGIYLINDVVDAESDRHHPHKRYRPVAAGALSGTVAVVVGIGLTAVAVGTAWLMAGWVLALIIAAYALVSVTYSIWLKRVPVIELTAVASGFVFRAIAGGAATHVPLSSWFLVVTSFGALFVVTGKRTAEYAQLGHGRPEHRAVLAEYTSSFLQSTLTLTASVTVTAYCLWAFDKAGLATRAGHRFVWIQLTVVPMILGTLYVLRLLDAGQGGAPDDLALHDRFLQGLGVVWLLLLSIGLYG